MDDLISGATIVESAKLLNVEATAIFEDTAFQLHKWHSNQATLESNHYKGELVEQTFAKQQLTQSGNGSFLDLHGTRTRTQLASPLQTKKYQRQNVGF